jgi:hypothetical protein
VVCGKFFGQLQHWLKMNQFECMPGLNSAIV